ncbi:MAG: hypothetical protein IKM08_02580 [Clostridia bacterium]|nr:hypothetical protein [Clostridia bacterium]
MLVLFRHNGRKYAWDTVAGSLSALSALELRMLEALTPPMTPVCPTALRYELAKYSSDAVEESYDALYEKAANGVIFAPENGTVRLPEADESTLRAALGAAACRLSQELSPVGENQELIREFLGTKKPTT